MSSKELKYILLYCVRNNVMSSHTFIHNSASLCIQQALMSPAVNRGSSGMLGDSHMHSQGTPAPLGLYGPSTPAPMTPHTPASADPGIVPQLQYTNNNIHIFIGTNIVSSNLLGTLFQL